MGRKKNILVCIIRWILFSMLEQRKVGWPQNRAPFSQLGRMCLMCYCPSIVCRCVFFSMRFIYSGWLSLFLTSSYIIHIHTDRQTTLSFFFLSFELCIYSNVTYYIEYYGLLLMTLVSVPLYIIRSSFIIYLFFFIERTSIQLTAYIIYGPVFVYKDDWLEPKH